MGSLPSHYPLPPSDILWEFNRNLTGYSTGTGGASEPNAFLNQAVPGAVAEYADFSPLWGAGMWLLHITSFDVSHVLL